MFDEVSRTLLEAFLVVFEVVIVEDAAGYFAEYWCHCDGKSRREW